MKKILDFIGPLINAENSKVLYEYENKIAKITAVTILSIGSVANIIFTYISNENREWIDIQNSLFLIAMALMFLLFDRVIKENQVKSNIYGLLFAIIFIYVSIFYYFILGPSIWSIAFVVIQIAMFKYKPNMMIVIGIFVIVMNVFLWITNMHYVIKTEYFVSQIIIFSVIIVIAAVLRHLNSDRFNRIMRQMDIIAVAKLELEKQYQALEIYC